ncbi:hypothetical protein GCM10020256_22710 [Streptomyces thermocoprophilus]
MADSVLLGLLPALSGALADMLVLGEEVPPPVLSPGSPPVVPVVPPVVPVVPPVVPVVVPPSAVPPSVPPSVDPPPVVVPPFVVPPVGPVDVPPSAVPPVVPLVVPPVGPPVVVPPDGLPLVEPPVVPLLVPPPGVFVGLGEEDVPPPEGRALSDGPGVFLVGVGSSAVPYVPSGPGSVGRLVAVPVSPFSVSSAGGVGAEGAAVHALTGRRVGGDPVGGGRGVVVGGGAERDDRTEHGDEHRARSGRDEVAAGQTAQAAPVLAVLVGRPAGDDGRDVGGARRRRVLRGHTAGR